MALTVRKRGTIYHARGTVRIGRESVVVREFSTGATSRPAALEAAGREEARIRQEQLEGPAGRARRLTVADCLTAYLTRPGGLQPYDVDRIAKLNDLMGARLIAEAGDGWQDWLRQHPRVSPATAARWRTILAAALRMGCEAHGLPLPKLPAVRQARAVRVAYLSDAERERLLAAYMPAARRPMLLLAYQGMRTQEVLQLDWRAVDLKRQTVHVRPERAKSGRGRTVPMHGRVLELLGTMWTEAGQPDAGPVFLSSRGAPYADTRGVGGNPLKKQHAHACQVAGVDGFRIHDWRHDWAARHVMAGTDLYTLMRLGGWASLRMVERYASVSAEHMRDAARRIA